MRNKILGITGLVALAGMTLMGGAAQATPQPETYVIVAWQINGTSEADPWGGGGQTLHASKATNGRGLGQLQSTLECETAYQIDLYYNNAETAALIAGGVLYGPNNPLPEQHVSTDGSTWKVLTTAPCPAPPVDVCLNIDGAQETIPEGYEAGPATEDGPTCMPADLPTPPVEGPTEPEVSEPRPVITPEPVTPEAVETPQTPETGKTLPVTGAEDNIALYGGIATLLMVLGVALKLARKRFASTS